MTEKQRLIKARMALLNLAAEVKNVAKVCKLAGMSRSQFYAMKKAFEAYGEDGLAPRVRQKPNMPNRTPSELEESILSSTRRAPTYSYIRLAREMNLEGLPVSATMIRYVWQRHGLSTRSARLEWLNKSSKDIGDLRKEDSQNGLTAVSSNTTSVDWGYWSQRVRESLNKE